MLAFGRPIERRTLRDWLTRVAARLWLLTSERSCIHSRMSIVADEIQTQPDLWRQAGGLARHAASRLPARGERACIVGCGTSLYVALAWAALREAAGHGPTDAFPASELPDGRRYDVLVAISRSGTTTEVVHALQRDLAERTVALTALVDSPVSAAADELVDLSFADERAVVQTRFATTALSLLRALVHPEATETAAADGERALAGSLPVEPGSVEQWTFLGRGWTVGLALEAALKLRETAQAWTEAYPAFEYRHGPIAIAAPSRVVWSLGPLHADIADQIRRTGAAVVAPKLDPLASLVLAQRTAVALAEARGLDPDEPRNLTRSIVLSDGELDVPSSASA
jgi:CRISPR-associated protein Cas5a/b/c